MVVITNKNVKVRGNVINHDLGFLPLIYHPKPSIVQNDAITHLT